MPAADNQFNPQQSRLGHVPQAAAYPETRGDWAQPRQVAEPILVVIGDVAVTQHDVVLPYGSYPLRGTVWNLRDNTRVERYLPGWAILFAVLFGIFLVGLLFLAVRSTRVTGHLEVDVVGHDFRHITQVPIPTNTIPSWVIDSTNQKLNYVRGLVAQLR